MSVYRKDEQGRLHKLAGNLIQRMNSRWFSCTRTEEESIEIYTVSSEAIDYFSTFNRYTVYDFGFTEPNTTKNPKLKFGEMLLDIKDFTNEGGEINFGQLNGVYTMFTKDLDEHIIYFCGNTHGDFLNDLDADKVILQEDLVLAGDYESVGNISKESIVATGVYETKGKSVAQVLKEIFAKRLQPKIVKRPALSNFNFQYAGQSVEAGTRLPEVVVDEGVIFTPGEYTYDADTGVEPIEYTLYRVDGVVETELWTTTDLNVELPFIDMDIDVMTDNRRINYSLKAKYSEGKVASDNLGDASDPEIRIAAGEVRSITPGFITTYRAYFYGATKQSTQEGLSIDSQLVRSLNKSSYGYRPGTITVNVEAGSTAIIIACVKDELGVIKVINETALNADVTSTFEKLEDVLVEGADGYTAQPYNVWYYVPAAPFENNATLKVTLG